MQAKRKRLKFIQLDPSILDDIIRRIVEAAQPEKIILFGSAARGEMNRHSDIDLLVVKDGADPWAVMGDIYGNLRGVGAAVDAIVVTSAQVKRYKDCHALVIKPALQEGRVIYEAPGTLSARRPAGMGTVPEAIWSGQITGFPVPILKTCASTPNRRRRKRSRP